ncbi:MAG: tRNA lysidine(34) synthetase TilS, partial [Fimbriimonadales bacterium]
RRRVRMELLPLMREIAPAFERHLLRLATILEQEEAWWEGEVASVLQDISGAPPQQSVKGESLLKIPRSPFTALHPAVQRRVLREWLRPHLSALHLPPFEIIEAIRGAAAEGRRASWQLSPTLRLTTDANALTLHTDTPKPKPYAYPVSLETPILIPEAEMWLELRSLNCPVWATEAAWTGKAQSQLNNAELPNHAVRGLACLEGVVQAAFDADAIQGSLIVRNGRPGDRFQPLGMKAPKKLSDIFIDRKVPKGERWRLPLLCDEAGIVWVPGYTIAERVRITPHTKRVLQATLYRNARTD